LAPPRGRAHVLFLLGAARSRAASSSPRWADASPRGNRGKHRAPSDGDDQFSSWSPIISPPAGSRAALFASSLYRAPGRDGQAPVRFSVLEAGCNHAEVVDLTLVVWPRERPLHTLRKALYSKRCMERDNKKHRPDLVTLRRRDTPDPRRRLLRKRVDEMMCPKSGTEFSCEGTSAFR
jgi:hypothetical protein